MTRVDPLHRFLLILFYSREAIGHRDLADDEHLAVEMDFTDRLRDEWPVRCIDTARLQRAPKGPGQSPSRRRDQIVDRCRGRGKGVFIDPVVLGDLGVDSECDRTLVAR